MNARGACAALALVVAVALHGAPEVTCATAESMAGMMEAWVAGYSAAHPAAPARIALRAKFSAEAFDALLRGEVHVAPFARELFPGERARFQARFGHAPLLVPIAIGSRATKGGTHAIAIFVHETNPLARLTLPQLRAVFAGGAGARTWGELGLGGEWAQRPIVVHGMVRRRSTGEPPGIVNFLEQRVLAGRSWRDDLIEHADVPGGRQALELIVRAVAADPAAIGCSGFGYAVPGVKTLRLAETDAGPFLAGTAEEVGRNEYPLSRHLYLCVDSPPTGPIRDFLQYALSAAGQHAVAVSPERFFPLPAREVVPAQGIPRPPPRRG